MATPYAEQNVELFIDQQECEDMGGEKGVEGCLKLWHPSLPATVVLRNTTDGARSHARCICRFVEDTDVAEAVRLMRVATQNAATDPRTGTIDMDMINTGHGASDR